MRLRSRLVFGMAGALWVVLFAGCQGLPIATPGASVPVGTGGTAGSGSGGTSATTEDPPGTGGTQEVGGTTGTGGVTAAGGTTGNTGGASPAGGAPGSGGTTTADAGAVSDSGNPTGGVGGRSRMGGRTGSGGRDGAADGDNTTETGGTTGGTSAGGTTGAGGSTASTGPLKKWFGNIDTRGSIRSDFASMWDQFSAENAGKWGSVQGGGQSSFNWSSLDRMYKYCEENDIIFKEHTFIWGAQQPSWVNNSNGEAAVKAWMKAFCERYPNTRIIDVVNEPLHPQPAYKEGIGGAGSSGWDWIVNALKWAREACPNAILVVNDYNTIEYSNENGRIISLVNAVKKAGGPIDAVGAQSHDIAKVSQSTMTSFGQKIIDQTGLPLHITEMDIGIADDNQQATRMKEFVTWAWENPKITGVTYWGYIVGATWRSNTGLMTDGGAKRPALTWLLSYLGR